MLTLFSVENFFSIGERQILDLLAARNAPQDLECLRPITPTSKDRAPTVVAIFGANASGKTNFLRALTFVVGFIAGTKAWTTEESAPLLPFFGGSTIPRPSRFLCEVSGQIIESSEPCLYRYELAIADTEPGTSEVVSESLHYAPKGRFRKLFERNHQAISVGADFQIKSDDQRLSFISKTTSLISTLAKFNHLPSEVITTVLRGVQSNVEHGGQARSTYNLKNVAKYYAKNPNVLTRMKERIRTMDLGITDVTVDEDQASGAIVKFFHSGLQVSIPYYFESDGTKNFFNLFPMLNYALETGGMAVIDELDRDIHPLLLPEIVRWFIEAETNPHSAQLVFTCLNASLLDHLQKEEVFITEKDSSGQTSLQAAKDVAGLRRDTSLYRKYLGGSLGGVPRIG
jgi:uncharacterized protein